MRKIILTCLLPLLIAFSPVNAQVKKAPVKPKPKTVAVKIPVLSKLDPFTKTPDDLVQFLNDEFKKLNLILTDIEETTTHQYNGTKQLQGVFSTSRDLAFTNEVSSIIAADANDNLTELVFEVPLADSVRYKAIKNMLAFAVWPVISKSDVGTTYKNGNIILYNGTMDTYDDEGEIEDSYYYLSVKKIVPYTYQPKTAVIFNSKALTINDNVEDVGYGIIKIMEGLGFALLYKQAEEPVVISNKLNTYTTRYQFKSAVSADIETTPFKKLKLINIDADDPISFFKIKKALGITGWKMYNSDPEYKTEFYEYNNLKCIVFGETKSITFTVTPERSDVISRIQQSEIPSLDDLMDIYHGGTKEQVIAAISSRYVNDFSFKNYYANEMAFEPNRPIDGHTFLIRTDDGIVPGKANFNFGLELPDKIIALFLESRDDEYMKRIYKEFQTGKYKDKYECRLNLGENGSGSSLSVIDIELNKKRKVLRGEK